MGKAAMKNNRNDTARKAPAPKRAGFVGEDPDQLEDIETLVDQGDRAAALARLEGAYPRDLVDLLTQLPFALAQRLFHWLPPEIAGQALAEMKPAYCATLLGEEPLPRIVRMVDALETDDATDVVAQLPPEIARKVMGGLADQEQVTALLTYPPDSAGGIMSARYVAVPDSATVAKATDQVRANAEVLEDIFVVFVVGPDGTLRGSIDLKQLLLSASSLPVREIMHTDIVSVRANVDQEEAALLMERYDLVVLPVTDAENRLVGYITIDDAVDVLREEAEEDLSHISGAPQRESPNAPVWSVFRGRIPWLLAGLAGAGLSGLVVGAFEHALQQAVILAGFIPIVMAMAGNAGIQSAAVTVQGLAIAPGRGADLSRRIRRELAVALLNGLALALVLGAVVMGIAGVFDLEAPLRLAIATGVSLLIVIGCAGTIGAAAPVVLQKLGVDPALATGPIITTSNDVIGVLAFFLITTSVYLA